MKKYLTGINKQTSYYTRGSSIATGVWAREVEWVQGVEVPLDGMGNLTDINVINSGMIGYSPDFCVSWEGRAAGWLPV